eukprot:2351929-Prymnesium_polylepis.1
MVGPAWRKRRTVDSKAKSAARLDHDLSCKRNVSVFITSQSSSGTHTAASWLASERGAVAPPRAASHDCRPKFE